MTNTYEWLEHINYERGYKLFEDTYLCVFDKCLMIAKTDKNGDIVRLTIFGEKREQKHYAER